MNLIYSTVYIDRRGTKHTCVLMWHIGGYQPLYATSNTLTRQANSMDIKAFLLVSYILTLIDTSK